MELERAVLFEELLARKENGEKLNISELTKDDLIQLWYKEHIALSLIAKLFEVPKREVDKLKGKWKLNYHKLMTEDLNKQLLIEYIRMKGIDFSLAEKELERAKIRIELAVGHRYEYPIECFIDNYINFRNNLHYSTIFKALVKIYRENK